jgi:hypothetical protein
LEFFTGGAMSATKEPARDEHADIRRVARNVHAALLNDEWPTAAGVEDFGLRSTEHYGALQYAVRYHGVTVEKLDDVLGNGPAITELIREGNPCRGVVFTTAWDRIMVSIKEWARVSGEPFPLGRLFATPATLEAVPRPEIAAAVEKHAAEGGGEHGVRASGSVAVVGAEIVSNHRSAAGREFCITTEADRSMTLVSLAGEF